MTRATALPPDQAAPANVAQTATAAGLGALVRVFVPKRTNWFLLVLGLLVGLAMAIILLGFVVLYLVFRSPNLNPAINRRRLYLYEHGFVLLAKPDQPQAFRWDGIDAVFEAIVSQRTYGVETERTYEYKIVDRDGRSVKLTEFWKDIAELGPYVNSSVSSALLPGALTAIEQGQGVQFGHLTLSATGIGGQRKTYTWPELGQVQISKGILSISIVNQIMPLTTVPAFNIPNLPLFFALINRLRQGAR